MSRNNKDQVVGQRTAWSAISKSIDKHSDVVASTLGPNGRNVLIEINKGVYHVTKDGVTVAKHLTPTDSLDAIGASVVKEASSKTVESVGDGTTTAAILTAAIACPGMQYVQAESLNNIQVKRGIDYAVKEVVKKLKEQAISINDENGKVDKEKLFDIAYISTNSDFELATIISDAILAVGKDGIVNVVDSNETSVTLETNAGFVIDYKTTPEYHNKTSKAVYENARVLVCEDPLKELKNVMPIINYCMTDKEETASPLVIVSPSIEGEVRSTLAMNAEKLPLVAISLDSTTPHTKDMLSDLALYLDGMVIGESMGYTFEDVKNNIESMEKTLGFAHVVSSDSFKTSFVAENNKSIEVHIRNLRSVQEEVKATDKQQSDYIDSRISRMEGRIATIKVGSSTYAEKEEIKDRVDDAVHACRAVIEEGYVAGGGTALRHISAGFVYKPTGDKSYDKGVAIVVNAIARPFEKLYTNTMGSSEGIWSDKEFKNVTNTYGFNAKTGEWCNMIESKVIDPVKVTRLALENAASSAGMLLTTENVLLNPNLFEDENKSSVRK